MSKFIISPHMRLQEWVAEEKGYFDAEGLDYEFRKTDPKNKTVGLEQQNKRGAYQTFEDGREFCTLAIDSVEPILFSELNDFHAQQENMTLEQLKAVIQEIYPGIEKLYVVSYTLVK